MTLLLKNLLFTVLVPGTVAVYLPILIGEGVAPASGPRLALAVTILAAGAAIYGWCLWDFATFGRGTPAPVDAPKRLVVRGLYLFVRNPMYLGVLTVILGWTLLFRTMEMIVYNLVVAAFFHLLVVFYEEPHLRRAFGREYEGYCARVGRWVPRLRRAD